MIGLHPSLVLVISFIIYCIVNATVLGYLLNRHFKLNRLKLFVGTAFIDSAFSLFMILVVETLFIMNYYRIHRLAECVVGPAVDHCPQFTALQMLLRNDFLTVLLVGLVAAVIQFFLVNAQYQAISDGSLIKKLMISNGVASLIKFLVIALLI